MFYKFSRRTTFYFYLSALIMMFVFLIINLVTSIWIPNTVARELGHGERVSYHYALFTTQSNYLVTAYFAYYLYTLYSNKSIPSFRIRLAVTVYISITMLIFWSGIITHAYTHEDYSAYNWVSTIILHFIMPAIMITSFIVTSGKEQIITKKWHYKNLWLIAIYPALYTIINLVRGYIRSLDGKPRETWYPYFFFDFRQHYGWLIVSSAIIVIFGLVFGLQYLYIWINNLKFKHSQNKKIRLENEYQKTLTKVEKKIKIKSKQK